MTTDTQKNTLITVDCRGLTCPLPILRMTRALRRIDVGQSVRVLATDVNSPTEFAAFCDISGHALIESTTAAGVFTLTIQKMAVD